MNNLQACYLHQRNLCRRLLFSLLGWLPLLSVGCAEETWPSKYGWKAEDFFRDVQVVSLCHAIESRDFTEIDRLIAAGADVKCVGTNGMTPLLWAYPGNDLELFEHILKKGADPNVKVTVRCCRFHGQSNSLIWRSQRGVLDVQEVSCQASFIPSSACGQEGRWEASYASVVYG